MRRAKELRDRFVAHIPWIEEKLKVQVSEADSVETADLILRLGVESPENCFNHAGGSAAGCSIWHEVENRTYADIYISETGQFFSQVLKHEVLHSLLPMGHLPEGNYLMSVSPTDPSQTNELSALEEKLLALYTHPYLRADMTMEQFRQYLVVE